MNRRLATFVVPLVLIAAMITLVPEQARANSHTRNALIALAPIGNAGPVELVAQTLDAEVVDSATGSAVTGLLQFRLHNTSRTAASELTVGFPSWGGGSQEFDEKSYSQFVILQHGNPVQAEWRTQPLRLGNETRLVRWQAWALNLSADERATVEVQFRLDFGARPLLEIDFAQAPSSLWRGATGSARYTFRLPAPAMPEQIRLAQPVDHSFDGRSITWLYAEFEPREPIMFQFVSPRIWREIVQARRAVAEGGNAKAATNLAMQYLLLARASHSQADLSQAIAAFERAAEFEPASPTAPRELARLYEAQLCGDFGPGAHEADLRAVALEQWERVLKVSPADVEALEAASQHAFLLAQLARRGGQHQAALTYLRHVRTTASGRLSTQQIQAEVRANMAALALQKLESGKWREVLGQVESGDFGEEARRDWVANQPQFGEIQATIVIEAERQTVSLTLVPFRSKESQHEEFLSALEAGVTRQAAARIDRADSADAYVLRIQMEARPLQRDHLPSGAELTMVRELLAPAELHIVRQDDWFASDFSFVARYSLTEISRLAQLRMQEIDRALDTLRLPARDETEEPVRLLRLEMLQRYRLGWQDLLAGSSARIEWRPSQPDPAGVARTWDLRAGDTRTLQARGTHYHVVPIVAVAAGSLAVILLAAWGVIRLRRVLSQR